MMSSQTSIRVMLVDDHKTMLWGLERLIDGENLNMKVVGTAGTCEEAVAQAGKLLPDVILLDLDLGGKCSLDILPALLANGVSRALILTASHEKTVLERAILSGARGVIHKEAPAEQVLKAIEKVHLGEYWLDQETLGNVLGDIAQLKAAQKPDPEAAKIAGLTDKERKIIALIVADSGASAKVLAQKLFIAEHTLRNHLTSIYQKLGVSNRLELYVYAVNHRMGNNN